MAVLAERQEGVVARRQLRALGLSSAAIDARRKRRNLHLLHPGVYAVGHRRISRRGRLLAAVLACGEGAVLSHHAAAELWGMRRPRTGPVDVTVPRKRRGSRGIRAHNSSLPDDEVTEHEGIPVTTPARTLLDLGGALGRSHLEAALNEADVLRLTDLVALPELLRRYPRRRGTRTLRSLIASRHEGDRITKRELEELFAAFIASYELPRPIANGLVEGFEVDCHWPAARLVVELDSLTYHQTRRAFERDRERDRLLTLAGWRVVRITWRQLTGQAPRRARDLRVLLG